LSHHPDTVFLLAVSPNSLFSHWVFFRWVIITWSWRVNWGSNCESLLRLLLSSIHVNPTKLILECGIVCLVNSFWFYLQAATEGPLFNFGNHGIIFWLCCGTGPKGQTFTIRFDHVGLNSYTTWSEDVAPLGKWDCHQFYTVYCNAVFWFVLFQIVLRCVLLCCEQNVRALGSRLKNNEFSR